MAPELSIEIILICSVVIFLAATILGFSGFGSALTAVPLLALVLDIKFVVPLILLVAFFSVLVLSANKLRFFRNPKIFVIFFGMIAGIIVGTELLANFDTAILKKALGVTIILFAIHIFSKTRAKKAPEPRKSMGGIRGNILALVVGVLSGIAGGVFGTAGPPLVVYIDRFAENKGEFRSQLLVLFVLHDIFRIPLYIHYGLMTVEVVKFGLWMLPAVCLGLLFGSRMHYRASEKVFSRAIATMLCVSGALLIFKV